MDDRCLSAFRSGLLLLTASFGCVFSTAVVAQSPTAIIEVDYSWGLPPLAVLFDASQSEVGGTQETLPSVLSYEWDLDGDGAFDDSTSVVVPWTYFIAGLYQVGLRVTNGEASDVAYVVITVGNRPPTSSIITPGPAVQWASGQVIPFEGEAVDPDEGVLPATALGWDIVAHNCAEGCVEVPIQAIEGVSQGSFVAPDLPYPSWLTVCLSSQDAGFPGTMNALWDRRMRITVDSDEIPGSQDLVDFPLLVIITALDLRYQGHGGSVGKLDGSDLIFASADGLATFAHEIESYDPTSGELVAWVRVPLLRHDVDTDLYLYYGHSGAPDPVPASEVWSSEYVAVWHLNESPVDGEQFDDSTSNGIDGVFHDDDGDTDTGAIGWIAGGVDFNGDADYVDFGNPTDLPVESSNRSMCAWAKSDTTDSGYRWIASFGTPKPGEAMFIGNGYNGTDLRGGGYADDVVWPGIWDSSDWHHVCLTFDGAVASLYADGALLTSQTKDWDLTAKRAYLARQVNDVEYWNGLVDEVRITNSVLSMNRIAAEHSNQRSPQTFFSLGPSETNVVELPLSGGQLEHTACVTINPATVEVTLDTDPAGLEVVFGNESVTAPVTRTAIVGSTIDIDAPSPQSSGSEILFWGSWSDGGSRAHQIVVPSTDQTLETAFVQASTLSILQEMTDMQRLMETASPAYKSYQASSYNRVSDPPCIPGDPCWFAATDLGNFDAVETDEDGTEYVMLDVDGPGAVTRIWAGNPVGVLRVYIDGATEPTIEEPLTALLSGSVVPFYSPLAHISALYAYNLYFPIPYATHCKITIDSNDPSSGAGLYYHVNYRTYAPGTSVQPFTDATAVAQQDEALAVAQILANPSDAYQPSPDHQSTNGQLTVNGGPVAIGLPGSVEPNGVVRELRLSPALQTEEALRQTLIEIRFDGVTTVQAPLGDFFGTGPGFNPYQSLAARIQSDGTLISNWAMPFQQSASIELLSDSNDPMTVDYELLVEPYTWAAGSLYFHASWRADHDVYDWPKRDWNLVNITGSGQYVGDVLNVANPFISDIDWWGEGDEKIWVDGESFPSHFGTGTEDYYGYAWAACYPFEHAYHNQTRCDGAPAFYGHTSLNRWRILDPIPFNSGIQVDLGQLVYSNDEKAVLFDAMTYWYATSGSTHDRPPLTPADLSLPALPARSERFVPGIVIEGEAMTVLSVDGLSVRETTGPFETDGRVWSRQEHRLWAPDDVNDELELGFDVVEPGEYCVGAYLTRGRTYAVAQIDVNDQAPIGPVDLWIPEGREPTDALDFGPTQLQSGQNLLRAEIVGVNPANPCPDCLHFGLDCISLVPSGTPTEEIALDVGMTQISWTPAADSSHYDLIQGDLMQLLDQSGDFSQTVDACLADEYASTELPYAIDPDPGQGFWFLVRGGNCSGSGKFDSSGAGQSSPRDALIEASPNACP